MTRNDVYKKKEKVPEKINSEEMSSELVEDKVISPETLQEMIDECKNVGITPWTIFLTDIGKIDVLDMTGTFNRITGESRLLVLDNEGGMWQVKEECVIARRTNIMKPDDYNYFNEMKKQAEENTKKMEEQALQKLDLSSGFV